MKAFWTLERQPRTITSPQDLTELIASMRDPARPTMLFLHAEDGTILVAGIGAADSVVTFVTQEETTFHSVGDLSRRGTLKFWCRDQLDDFFAEMAVPESVAIDALVAFLETSARPANVDREADW